MPRNTTTAAGTKRNELTTLQSRHAPSKITYCKENEKVERQCVEHKRASHSSIAEDCIAEAKQKTFYWIQSCHGARSFLNIYRVSSFAKARVMSEHVHVRGRLQRGSCSARTCFDTCRGRHLSPWVWQEGKGSCSRKPPDRHSLRRCRKTEGIALFRTA